jgi:hypothetical protein
MLKEMGVLRRIRRKLVSPKLPKEILEERTQKKTK